MVIMNDKIMLKLELTGEKLKICEDLGYEHIKKLHEEINRLDLKAIDKIVMTYAIVDVMKSSYEAYLKENGVDITDIRIKMKERK